ncbi:MAG: DUF58 domain-containing protein [bacterium]|nr:DUF58 domain-containing protein [bacterium]
MQEFILQIKKKIQGKYFSHFESIFKGSGIEVHDFRPYQTGDTPKSINRKLSAKQQQLFINLFQEEKSIDLDIFLDINYNRKGKFNQEINSRHALNLLSDILVYSQKYLLPVQLFYPQIQQKGFQLHYKKRDTKFTNIYQFLDTFPQLLNTIPRYYHTLLPAFLEYSIKHSKTRAIVIISDFLDLQPEKTRLLQQLNKDHKLILFQIPVHKYYGQNYESHKILHIHDIPGICLSLLN